MPRPTTLLVCCTALVSLTTAAYSADLGVPPLPPYPAPVPVPVDTFNSSWYVRADAAYRANHLGTVTSAIAPDPTAASIANSAGFGVGIGIKRNWFRSDVTVDFGLPAKYYVDTSVLPITYTARIESWTTLVNFYADLGSWLGLTPYIGAGVGGSYLRTTEFQTATAVPPISSGPGGSYNFSWALMTGVSYNLGHVAIDLGYRHLNLGPAVTSIDASGNQLNVKNLAVDEFRVGLRLPL